jgi:acetyl-CoA C-acetyltransferase
VAKFLPQKVYLVDGARTPFSHQLRQNANSNNPPYSKLDLAVFATQGLLLNQSFNALQFDDVVIASSTSESDSIDLSQQLSNRLQCNASVIPHTFPAGEHCAMQALQYAYQQIAFQKKSLVLLGGSETATTKPITLNHALSTWIRDWQTAKGLSNKLKVFNTLHTQHFYNNSAKKNTLKNNDHLHKEKAEKIANYFSIATEAMAEYVKLSQRRLNYAQRNNLLKNITPLFYPDGSSLHRDDDVINTDPASLNKTIITGNPPTGIITQTSVTQTTNGACMLLLANQDIINKYNLTPLATLSEPQWGNEDTLIENLLDQHTLQVDDIDYWEWDETSAAEILALEQKKQFKAIESFQSLSNINIDGGSLALGNPNTANKFRCILQLATILQRTNSKNGICHFSFAKGPNTALLLENSQAGKK